MFACACLNSLRTSFLRTSALLCPSGWLGARVCGRGLGPALFACKTLFWRALPVVHTSALVKVGAVGWVATGMLAFTTDPAVARLPFA